MSQTGLGELPVFAGASNTNVCAWFYAMFWLAVAVFVLNVAIYSIAYSQMKGISLVMKAVFMTLTIGAFSLGVVQAGFLYTMCNRAL